MNKLPSLGDRVVSRRTILKMIVRDAEANAEVDARGRKNIVTKNEMDSQIYSTEKSRTDNIANAL